MPDPLLLVLVEVSLPPLLAYSWGGPFHLFRAPCLVPCATSLADLAQLLAV